ncbi:hypothetical protein NC99_04160 [Sunxiuqinia dokdonensis]|uniref:Uncharacterized protein n=1 Tax=Sunxiuqinia dokdonensis TaxID=1409788 RepID=A0A0L8VE66_9BACT|nr:hypothetical protein NC99_04160 [Sunxiuqinia dokdonensis]
MVHLAIIFLFQVFFHDFVLFLFSFFGIVQLFGFALFHNKNISSLLFHANF